MFNFMRILLASFFLFSSAVFANDSFYFIYTGVNNPPKYASAQSACDAYFDRSPLQGASKAPVLKRDNEPYWRCQVLYNDTGQHGQYGFVERHSCPAGTGECVPPPHQCEVGDVIGPYKYPGVLSGGFVTPVPPAPTSACKNGCEYSRSSKSSGCQSGVFGTFCTYTFTGTGVDCTSSPDNDMGGDSGEGPNANDGGDGGQGQVMVMMVTMKAMAVMRIMGMVKMTFRSPETSTAEGDAKESTLQEVKAF